MVTAGRTRLPPCVIHEDEDLLVINKPAGVNTHAPSPYAGEGIYDWLRHREPRWAHLAIIQRLDKETSGVMVFSKSPRANRSLTGQFASHLVRKKYLFLSKKPVPKSGLEVRSHLVKVGEKYISRPAAAGGVLAETHFRSTGPFQGYHLCEAVPLTGRTHQIRVHAAQSGLPIVGDVLYGGEPAERVYLHAREISFQHPGTSQPSTYGVAFPGMGSPTLPRRRAFIDPAETNAFRVVHGAADGFSEWYVDRLGEFLYSQSENPLTQERAAFLEGLMRELGCRGAYHKALRRQIGPDPETASPTLVLGDQAVEFFPTLENGLAYETTFTEGYSVGLFLDQRDNRRRLLTRFIAAGFALPSGLEVLNTFSYTCGFSLAAAVAGDRVTSVDLSKKYLDWGRRNFQRNRLELARHDFIHGDVLDWLKRFRKKGRHFDLIIFDPPTFSRSKTHGTFQAERDLPKLLEAALPLLNHPGFLFVSINAARLSPSDFIRHVETSVNAAGRKIIRSHFVPQPPDFPIHPSEPAHLKTIWLEVN